MRLLPLLLVATLAATPALAAEGPGGHTIVVQGTGSVDRVPDRAVVQLAVESKADTAKKAADANAAAMTKVLAALRKAGVAETDVQTSDYELRWEEGLRSDGTSLKGFVAINRVSVKIEKVARTGDVIDAALAAGANRVDFVSFTIADPTGADRAALKEAVTDARARAEVLAAAAGARLGPVVRIEEGGGGRGPMPILFARKEAATPIEPGTVSTQANVTVTFALIPPT